MTAMAFHETATRLWKALSREERLLAASAFFRDPAPDLIGSALGVVVEARRMRPQAARALPPEARARIVATVLDPGETLAQGLLVSLHLAERRPLLVAFLDALEWPHDNGLLTEDGESAAPPSRAAAGEAVKALAPYPRDQVQTYLNTLWLQDPERWAALPEAADQGI
jgi:hypothetical protein